MLRHRQRGLTTILGLMGLGLVLALVLVYRGAIITEPGEHISRAHIRQVIAQESPVLYNDGKTRIGVFFAKEHRTYVPFDEIPRSWVSAIVAAEDQRFWDHGGVDVFGIARAMLRNVSAGRMVAGGSTLTQQTAKNLYYRPDRSLGSKWTELLNALRLEAVYSKEEILEFYANQFHVSSNGRGLGIAARYFFDKSVSELGTLESAFLAGLVKAPARYNPFVGGTAEARAEARERARHRTRYVLDRMKAEGVLTESVHADLVATEIPFKKGRFQYESNVVLDEVESRLSQAPFPALFESLNIDNPSTAGISVVTTLSEEAQRGASYALWHHLSEVGPIVEAADASDFALAVDSKPRFDPSRSMAPGTFHQGRALAGEALEIQLPNGSCVLDDAAIQRVADVVARSRAGNTWAKAGRSERDQVVALVRSGAPVLVSVRAEQEGALICDLERRPKLQGAVMLLEEGRIRAMVGGNDNRNFNRAISARRQLGSIWKPVLYNAALQLGWTPTDVVDNRSNVFHFEGTWYYPRADHDNQDWTSLAWLGTRSENLGSIWLLLHLTDRLAARQFEMLAEGVGLTRKPDEEWMAYIRRIRDDEGVISTDSRLNEMAFTAAKLELVEQMGPESEEAREVRSLFYGRTLEAEIERVRSSSSRVKERLTALSRSYRALAKIGTACIPVVNSLVASVHTGRSALEGVLGEGHSLADLPESPDMETFSALGIDKAGHLHCQRDSPELRPVTTEDWQDWVSGARDVPDTAAAQAAGGISLGVLTQLHAAMKRRLLVWGSADPYDWSILQYHPDMRTLVGLRYMDKLAETFGVREPLPPVLSIPLGAVDISLEEAATLYQGLMDGQTWSFPGQTAAGLADSPAHPTQLIAEIRDASGAVLYRARPVPRPVVDPEPGRLVGDVLRNVVRWGTGRRALNAVMVDGQPVPLAGKTGTTNGYRNAAFAGFVPRHGAGGWEWASGYTLVTYVGYDDNTPMRRAGVRLQGSNGALPVWIGTARAMADAGLLGQLGGEVDPEWQTPSGHARVAVDEASGLVLTEDSEGAQRSVLVEGSSHRRFSPVGMASPVAMDLEVIGAEKSVPTGSGAGASLIDGLDTGIAAP